MLLHSVKRVHILFCLLFILMVISFSFSSRRSLSPCLTLMRKIHHKTKRRRFPLISRAFAKIDRCLYLEWEKSCNFLSSKKTLGMLFFSIVLSCFVSLQLVVVKLGASQNIRKHKTSLPNPKCYFEASKHDCFNRYHASG